MAVFIPNFITVNGKALDVVDNSIKLEGFSGIEKEAVLGASGHDDTKRKRVERKITCEVKLSKGFSLESLWFCDAQLVVGMTPDCNQGTSRRARCNPCDTISVGEINEGIAEVSFLVKAPVEWL